MLLDLPVHSNRSRPINPTPNPLRRNILSGLILVVLGETKESGPISQIVKAAGGTVRVFAAAATTAATSVEEFKAFMDGILSALLPDKDFVCVRKCSKLPKLAPFTAYLSKEEKDVPIVEDASICTIVVSLQKSSVFKRTFRPLVDGGMLASPSSNNNTKIPAKRSIHEAEAPSSEIIPPTPPTAHVAAVKLKSRRLSSQEGPQISTKSIYSHYESVVSDVEEEENAASPAPTSALGRGGGCSGSNGPSAGQRDTQVGGHESFQTFQTQPEFSALDSFMDDILGLGSGPSSFKPAPAPAPALRPRPSGYEFIAEEGGGVADTAAAAGSGSGRAGRPGAAALPIVNTRKSWRLGGGEGVSSIPDSPVPPTQHAPVPDIGSKRAAVPGKERGKRRDWTIPDRLVLDADKEEEEGTVNQKDDVGGEEEEVVVVKKKKGRAAKPSKKGEQEKDQESQPATAAKKKKQKSLESNRVIDPSSIAITVQVTSLFSKKEKRGASLDGDGKVDHHVQKDGGVGVENFKRFVKNGTVGTKTRILDQTTTIFQTKLVTVVPATAL